MIHVLLDPLGSFKVLRLDGKVLLGLKGLELHADSLDPFDLISKHLSLVVILILHGHCLVHFELPQFHLGLSVVKCAHPRVIRSRCPRIIVRKLLLSAILKH